MKKSTTDFVDYADPDKQVTRVVIHSNAKKPITEYKDKQRDGQTNSMFLSGYTGAPSSGLGRFGNNAHGEEGRLEESTVIRNETYSTVPLADSRYIPSDGHGMSTSVYMGNVVTNRLLSNGGTAASSKTVGRKANGMYHSQALGGGGTQRQASTRLKLDSHLLVVPPKVQQFLDNSHNEVKYLQKDVVEEKLKMNSELDAIQQTIMGIIDSKRRELNGMYDEYLEVYKANIESLKASAARYKDPTEASRVETSENGDRLVRLTDIVYYTKKDKDGVYREYKTESHKNICELRDLNQEVRKHNLEFYLAELERMSTHSPTFANTSSSAEYLNDLKVRLFKEVETGVDDFGKLVFLAKYVNFKELLSEPHIFTSLGETRVNCLTNMRDLSNQSVISSRLFPTSHEYPITSILNIDDESFASGDEGGVLNVFNHQLAKETHKFKLNGVSAVTSLGRIRTTHDLVGAGDQMRASQSQFREKHDKNIFLLSGHAKPDCIVAIWDMKKQAFVKQLKGHTDDVTAISSLQDGHTLFTGSKSGDVIVFNITKKEPVKKFSSLARTAINCLYTFNDLSRIAVGYANGEITILSIQYEIDPVEKLAVCSSCVLAQTLKDKSSVNTINESHIEAGKIITGHEDHSVKIWDLKAESVLKQIQANATPVIGLLVIENPFAIHLEENYHIISCGQHQDDIYFNLPKQNKHFQLKFQVAFDLKQTQGRNPKLQLYRGNGEKSEQGINFVTFVNSSEVPQLLLISIK